MIKTEIWAVEYSRIEAYFAQLTGSKLPAAAFLLNGCTVNIRALPMRKLGSLSVPQTEICITGPEKECNQVYDRFFMRFISAGG